MLLVPRDRHLLAPPKPHTLKYLLARLARADAHEGLLPIRKFKPPLHEHFRMTAMPIGGVHGYGDADAVGEVSDQCFAG